MTRQFPALTLAAIILGLSLSGCTAPATPAPTTEQNPPVSAQPDEPVELLWQTTEELASNVLLIDGLVLAYLHERGQLKLIARERDTGQLRWQKNARTGQDPSGMRIDLATVTHAGHTTHAFLEAVGDTGTRITVLDIQTGDNLTTWGEDYWGYRPDPCGQSWCAKGIDQPTQENHRRQERILDWDSGNWDHLDPRTLKTPKPHEARYLGLGLSSTAEREPLKERLVFASDGQIRWEQPYEEVFATQYSSDSGWKWERFHEPQRILIGTGSRAWARRSEQTYLLDWAKDFSTVGLEESTGEVLWRFPGAQPDCSGALPNWVSDERRTMILCRIDRGLGTVAQEVDGRRAQNITGLSWRVTAIDTYSGEEQWSHPMPSLERYRELLQAERFILTDQQHAYLPLEQGWRAIDIHSGEIKNPAQVYEDTVLCAQYRDSLKFEDPHDERGQYVNLAPAIYPCERESLEPTSKIPTVTEFQRAGYEGQRHVALSGEQGILLYQLPEIQATAQSN